MDGKLGTFLLGIIAAVVLFMLWNEQQSATASSSPLPVLPPNAPTSAVSGCGSCGASPSVQAGLESVGTAGLIPPPGVPLGTPVATGAVGSIQTSTGLTPDTSFTFGTTPNVPGSPTTPSASTPVRATQSVAPYSTGFHQHYNILGVPVKGYLQ